MMEPFAGQCLSKYRGQQCSYKAGPHLKHESDRYMWVDEESDPPKPLTEKEIERGREVAAMLDARTPEQREYSRGYADGQHLVFEQVWPQLGAGQCGGSFHILHEIKKLQDATNEAHDDRCKIRDERDQLRADLASAQQQREIETGGLTASVTMLVKERDAAREEAARLRVSVDSASTMLDEYSGIERELRAERDALKAELADTAQLKAELGQALATAMRKTAEAAKKTEEIERLKEANYASACLARRAHEDGKAAQAELSQLRAAGPTAEHRKLAHCARQLLDALRDERDTQHARIVLRKHDLIFALPEGFEAPCDQPARFVDTEPAEEKPATHEKYEPGERCAHGREAITCALCDP